MVKKGAELLMIVEAADQNWYDQTERSPGNFLCRLGARHGKRTADGKNAWTNMAFLRRNEFPPTLVEALRQI